jgi:hypothetical protein
MTMSKTSGGFKSKPSIDLRALEEEVLAEGQRWMKRRMEEKLQERGESFSPGEADDA